MIMGCDYLKNKKPSESEEQYTSLYMPIGAFCDEKNRKKAEDAVGEKED